MFVYLPFSALQRAAIVLILALVASDALAVTLQERGGHPHPSTRSSRAAKCKGVLNGYKNEARTFCAAYLQSRTMTVTVPAVVQTVSTTSTSIATTQTTLPDVQTTTTATSIVTLPTTTTLLQRRHRPQQTGEPLAKRRKPASLQSLIKSFSPDVVADACSLFLYGHLEQPQTTTTTAAAQTTTMETTTTTTVTVTDAATSTSVSTKSTTTTTAQATQSVTVNHVVAPGFEQCTASDYMYAPQPDPVACPWTIDSDGYTIVGNDPREPHTGSKYGFYNLDSNSATFAQVLAGVTPNVAYTLTYFRAYTTYVTCSMAVSVDSVTIQDSLAGVPNAFPPQYRQNTLAFTPTSSTPTISFKAVCGPNDTGAVMLDDVSFARTV